MKSLKEMTTADFNEAHAMKFTKSTKKKSTQLTGIKAQPSGLFNVLLANGGFRSALPPEIASRLAIVESASVQLQKAQRVARTADADGVKRNLEQLESGDILPTN